MLKIAIIKGVLASYSKGFYERLISRNDLNIQVYCQDKIPGVNVEVIHNLFPHNVQLVKFWSIGGDKFTWQFIPWKKIIKDFDVIFVEGNPRNLSHALFASYLRLIRKKVVLWTMAHSYRSNLILERIRLAWSRIFKYLLVYNDDEVEFLRSMGFNNKIIIGMNNGLDQSQIEDAISSWLNDKLDNWQQMNNLKERTIILSCARIVSKNKFHHMVLALPSIVDKYPNLLWCIIGDGPEKNKLQQLINSYKLTHHVRFVGELYNENEIAPWFLSSKVFVHPAAIGLSLLHAFGYGLPVVTHGTKKRHGPEYSAFQDELSGYAYQEDDVNDLSKTVIRLLDNPDERMKMKINNQRVVREKYNVDIMTERFIAIAIQANENED